MNTFESTLQRQYPLPHPDNLLQQDVQRLRAALNAIDGDMHATADTQAHLQQQLTQLQRRNRLKQLLGADSGF